MADLFLDFRRATSGLPKSIWANSRWNLRQFDRETFNTVPSCLDVRVRKMWVMTGNQLAGSVERLVTSPLSAQRKIPHSLANTESSAALVINIPATGTGVVKFPVRSRPTFLNIPLPPTCVVVKLVASRFRGKRQTVGPQLSEAPRAKETH